MRIDNPNVNVLTTTLGIFWANGVAYSSGGGTTFTGNLLGNPLTDSTSGRVFVNASPYSAITLAAAVPGASSATPLGAPIYSGTAYQPQNAAVSTAVFQANIQYQSSYQTSTNKTLIGNYNIIQAWPLTANTMTQRDRIRNTSVATDIVLNGKSWGMLSLSSQYTNDVIIGSSNALNILTSGESGDATCVYSGVTVNPSNGSANVNLATSYKAAFTHTTGSAGATASNIAYYRMLGGVVTPGSPHLIQNAIGLHTQNGWASTGTSTVTNRYALLNEDAITAIQSNGNLTITGNTVLGTAGSAPTYTTSITGNTTMTGNLFINQSGITAGNIWVAGSGTSQITLNSNVTINQAATLGTFKVNSPSYTFAGNGTIGSATSGYGTTLLGNLSLTSAVPYGLNVTGNTVLGGGGATSFNTISGNTIIQGNIQFNSSYRELVTALGNKTGTVTIDSGIGNAFTMTLTGDITINSANITNMLPGKSITLIITQDGTGSRLLSSNMKFAGGLNTLSSAAGAIDVMNIYYDGTNYLASLVKGYV